MGLEILGLLAVLVMVLVLPFSVKWVEEELEAFLFAMGAAAVTVSGLWSRDLVLKSLHEPLLITAAVLVAGLAFRAVCDKLARWIEAGKKRFGMRVLIILLVSGLGLLSSVITAIIAALVLAEAVTALKLPRAVEVKVVILACFSIGLGAVLTPVGEPLATVAVSRLSGEPHHADFWFLARLLGPWVLPLVLGLGIWAGLLKGEEKESTHTLKEDHKESYRDVLVRTGKVYLFVMALVLLGEGFAPFVDRYLIHVPGWALYWINSISAVLDNATLTAAEISPQMSREVVSDLLLGLLISGGMLIPGNIPNIISASKLGIKSKEWARFGVPVGAAIMAGVFVLLMIF
jgi:predicted cation transporter